MTGPVTLTTVPLSREGVDILIHSAMRDIYERLAPLGFDSAFIKRCILPDWWEDRLAEVPSNRQYAEAVIARQLGIEMSSLHDQSCALKVRRSAHHKLKSRAGATAEQLQSARVLGERIAKLAASALSTAADFEGLTASSIRQRILDSGAKWVGFHELLDFCWGIGIPVVHLCQMPANAKKPDGMAVWTEDRPVIVVSSSRKQPAWHIFIMAHELGHIVLGHLSKGEVSLDAKVALDPTDERDEAAANSFAMELLSGYPDLEFGAPPRRINAQHLVRSAVSTGQRLQIDPGFLILSYSRSQGFFALAGAALNHLSPQADACGLYQPPYGRLDVEEMAEDSRHVFECLTEAA